MSPATTPPAPAYASLSASSSTTSNTTPPARPCGCFLDWTIKATHWEEGEKRTRELTQRDFIFFALRGLLTHGFRKDEVPASPTFQAPAPCAAEWTVSTSAAAPSFVGALPPPPWTEVVGEGSLRRAIDQFCDHYHRERSHQGLENKIIDPEFGSAAEGEVNCRQRLGGLLRYYYRDAA